MSPLLGPFAEYRAELGIQADNIRLRVKLDYSVLPPNVTSTAGATTQRSSDETTNRAPPPALHLRTMTVCREAVNQWPRSSSSSTIRALFGGPVGAPGGLYDPPPVGSVERAAQYCLLDLEGEATILFPAVMDQTEDGDDDNDDDNTGSSSSNNNWVTSLDWTAGPMRYQVDRKVHGGINLMGLRTLELSEVQGADADQYRPRDGGQNMRQ